MEPEKRIVGSYEITAAFPIGEKEVLLGIDEQNAAGDYYFCCDAVREGLLERYERCVVSGDYLEIAEEYGRRITAESALFRESVKSLGIPVGVITPEECIPDDAAKDICGKVIAIRAEVLRPEYQRADQQLLLVEGGFGASASARGSAVFAVNLLTGARTRVERRNVLGEVRPERMPVWAKNRLLILQGDKRVFAYAGSHFVPYRMLLRNESGFDYIARHIRSDRVLDLTRYGAEQARHYDYRSFYAASGKALCDLFLCLENDRLYLPGENELFLWTGERGEPELTGSAPQKKAKKRGDYER